MKTYLYIFVLCSFLGEGLSAQVKVQPEDVVDLPASIPPAQNYKPVKMKSLLSEMADLKKNPHIGDAAPGLSQRFSTSSKVSVVKDLSREEIRSLGKSLPGGTGEVEVHYLASAEERALALSELRQKQSTLISKIAGVHMQLQFKEEKAKNPNFYAPKMSNKSLAELNAELDALTLQRTTLEKSITALKDPAVPLEKSVKAMVTPMNPTAALETYDQLALGRKGVRIPVAVEAAAGRGKVLSRVLPGTSLLIMGAALSEGIMSNNSDTKSSTATIIEGSR